MIPLGIQVMADPPLEGLGRAHTRSMIAAHQAMGDYDRDTFLPTRFAPGPGHAQRALSTQRKKLKRGKPLIPLVWSGVARSIATQQNRVKAYPTRVTITIPGPSYFTMRRKDPTKIFLVGEALWRSSQMIATLEKIGGQKYEEAMKAEHEKKQITT